MMRALLFLGLAGAAIYGFLIVTQDALSDGSPKHSVVVQTRPNHSVGERLSSWGSYLPSRSQSENPELATSQQPATLPSQERSDPSQNTEHYQVASENRAGSPESDGLKAGSSIAAPAPAQVAAESTTEPLTAKPPVRKSSKRSRSAKHGVVVADADPWNGRWARRAERRRGFGLFMFRPVPRFMVQGR
jgi:hypothetical protein